jgi:heavy metal translocating P-type ATPase
MMSMIEKVEAKIESGENTASLESSATILQRLRIVRTLSLGRRYPLVAFAAIGILVGLLALPFGVNLYGEGLTHWIFALVTIGGGAPLVLATLGELLRGHIYADVVAALAIVGSALLGQFEAGAIVVLMQSGGEALEDYGLQRASRSLENLLKRAPTIAHRKVGSDYVDLPVAEVNVRDILLVRPGDIVPVDGVVLEGQGAVDESALTGEPVPLDKLPGDELLSGTINLSGALVMRATKQAKESKYELIVKMVEQAQTEKAPISRLADQYAPGFTFVTLALAAAVYGFSHDWVRVLAVLVVATPCPLIIATPLAVLSAINRAARKNIIVKSGASIEQAAGVEMVIFDKTGTLTIGRPTFEQVISITPGDENRLLGLAASVELFSSHVLARPLVEGARKAGLRPQHVSDFEEIAGKGVSGVIDDHRYDIGSPSYLREIGTSISEGYREELTRLRSEGGMLAVIAEDKQAVGVIVFSDKVRPEARNLRQRLEKLGVLRTVMLTGDNLVAAQRIADQVGISEVRANLLPEDKVKAIAELKRGETRVMMVGDGINDAPALATATVGVALGGHGAGISTDAADIVLMVDNVERVADVINIGRTMVRVAKQGIFFGIGASVVCMVVAAFGFIPPTVGAILQEAIDVVVILGALRSGLDRTTG